MGLPISTVATVCALAASPFACAAEPEPPLGLSEVSHPDEKPPAATQVALGERLFFDKSLSVDGTVSCATCHVPEQAFAQAGSRTSEGVGGRIGRRNSPSILNVAFAKSLFLDGRSGSLEDQAWQPILDKDEMGNPSVREVLDRLAKSEEYTKLFKEAFDVARPDKPSVAKALASYQRTLLSGNSRFDRWHWGGESELLTELEKEGYELFAGQALCWQCHPIGGDGIMFTDGEFHNTGVGWLSEQRSKAEKRDQPAEDFGRFEVTEKEADRWRYKTPSLRNVALTAPYMHDGSFANLKEVVEFYNRGGGDDNVQRLDLEQGQLDALVAFLGTLTGDQSFKTVR